MKRVLYPGSFDPPTYGHMNVVEQATNLFDEVIIAVMQNSSKGSGFFTIEERIALLEAIYQDYENIKIVTGSGAAVDLAMLYKCQALLRGLRGVTDFEYELQLAAINRKLSEEQISTICLFPDNQVQHISSSVVKELYSLDKDVKEYVHPVVKEKMLEKRRVWK